MTWLIRLVIVAVCAGLVHIASLFTLPALLGRDAFSLLAKERPFNTLALIEAATINALPFPDPATALAVCRYDLADGPLRVRTRLSDTFLSIVFADLQLGVFSSVSDRAATRGMLDVVLATQKQLDRITALDDRSEAIEEVRTLAPGPRGLVILKVLVDRPSGREAGEAVLRAASCETESLPDEAR